MLFILLIVSCFALMLLGKADTVLIERIRGAAVDLVSPIMSLASRPAASIDDVTSRIESFADLYEENLRLREENRELLAGQQIARNLNYENKRLRELTHFANPPAQHEVSARVIGDMGGAFAQSMMISAGTRDGVQKGQAVLSDEGLIGRIADAGYQASRVLLITDINSRIPVLIENSRDRAFLSGDNTDRPILTFLTADASIAPGDRVLTSGHGGAFPPGIPVGIVSSVSENAVRVAPLFRRHQVEYLRVVNYGLAGILKDPDALHSMPHLDEKNQTINGINLATGVGVAPMPTEDGSAAQDQPAAPSPSSGNTGSQP